MRAFGGSGPRPPRDSLRAEGFDAMRAVREREGDDEEDEQRREEGPAVDANVQHRSRVTAARRSPARGLPSLPAMADRSPRILLVDDEQPIQTLLSFPLQLDGYDVVAASDGNEALTRFSEQAFDLVVLDLMLPRLDGLEVCRRLRAQRSTVPIIMLTAKSEEIDKVLGLELGADDYITKPFSMREFRSRVKAVLRRAGMARAVEDEEQALEVRGLRIDPAKRTVTLHGAPVQTTFVEFEILAALARSPGRVWTRDMLLSAVWGDSAYRDPRTIDVHIRHLREKLEADPKEPEYLFTVRGVGYRFRDDD
jgi:DNA-binding response OmpR family regulator